MYMYLCGERLFPATADANRRRYSGYSPGHEEGAGETGGWEGRTRAAASERILE